MCLSTVYKMTDTGPAFLCKNIQNVEVDPGSGKLTFTDVMGIRYESMAKIQSIDLIENVITIEEEPA